MLQPTPAPFLGQMGGRTLYGNRTSSGTLTLSSTSNATKGKILFGTSAYDEVNNRLGINTASPATTLAMKGTAATDATTIGSQLIGSPNAFNNGARWSASGWTTTLTTATAGASAPALVCLWFTPTTNNFYYINFSVGSWAYNGVDTLSVSIGDNFPTWAIWEVGTYSTIIQALDTTQLTFTPSANWTGQISAVSCYQITPIQAITTVLDSSSNIVDQSWGLTGGSNYAAGPGAMSLTQSPLNNVGIGSQALQQSASSFNVGIGFQALAIAIDASENVGIGSTALSLLLEGSFNVALGEAAMSGMINGTGNVAIGANAIQNAVGGSQNIAIGYTALSGMQRGSNNTAVGYGVTGVLVGANNTLIGANAHLTSDFSNGTTLGYNTSVSGAGGVAIGVDSSGGAATAASNVIALGTANHKVQLKNNTTGAGSASLSTNCPAVTPTAPYTWFRMMSSDGSTVFVPAWK